jgi:hypothetical protein
VSETVALAILLAVAIAPVIVAGWIVQRAAARRRWSLVRTRVALTVIAVGWPTLLLLTIARVAPVSTVLLVAAVMLVLGYLQLAGIHGWYVFFRRRRGEPTDD